jgi:mevalonate kinase
MQPMYSSVGSILKANGKLLLTGEYLVLDGATALAFPTRLGQTLTTSSSSENYLTWIASDINGIWFTAKYSLHNFEIIAASDHSIALTLQKILTEATALNPEHIVKTGLQVNTELNFNRFMGLGSSSTLIALIADLFDTDKYQLHKRVSSGSGYDIACTDVNYPIFYTRKSVDEATISPVNFNPLFISNLWLAWLGNKQDTNAEIKLYGDIRKSEKDKYIKKATEISMLLPQVKELTTFTSLIEVHEELISTILNRDTIKRRMFNDFKGCVKSLGAWGGDYVLACSDMNDQYVFDYFAKKDINTVYHFKDLVLNEQVSISNDTIIRF